MVDHHRVTRAVRNSGVSTRAFGARRPAGGGAHRLPAALRVIAAAAGVALLAAACSTGGGGGATGKDFYKGKTITYIVPSAPGNPTGDQIVDMQSSIEKYLGAKINIRYQTTGQSAPAYDQTASASADGLTIGEVSPQVVASDVLSGSSKGGITFDMTKLTWLGSVGNTPILLVACKGSPIKTMDDLVKSTSQVSFVSPTVGSSLNFDKLLMAAYPVSHKYLTGYTTATTVQGCERGDGTVSAVPVTNWTTADGKAIVSGLTPLLLSGTIPSAAPSAFLNSQVPQLTDFIKTHPASSTQGTTALKLASESFTSDVPEINTAAPAGIPADRANALSDAIKYALDQPTVQQELAKDSLGATYISPADTVTYVNQCQAQTQQISAFKS